VTLEAPVTSSSRGRGPASSAAATSPAPKVPSGSHSTNRRRHNWAVRDRGTGWLVWWSWAGAGVYFLRNVWWQKMMRFHPDGRRRRAIQADKIRLLGAAATTVAGVGILGWFSAGPVGAVWLPVKLLVVPFLVFVQIIGWTVHVHHVGPDIRWWTRREWSQFRGQMESTTILRFPAIVNRLWFHNIFVHVPHHVDPRIPFHQLPAAADAIVTAYPDTVKTSRFSLRGYLRATRRCKLYDFDAGRWLAYPAAAP